MAFIADPTKKADWALEKDAKQAWLKALRSGKFKQGKAMLYNPSNDTYCCLGLLCVVAGVDKKDLADVSMPSKLNDTDNAILHEGSETEFFFVPVLEKCGAYSERHTTALSDLNDKMSLNFNEIADIIEATVDTY